MRLSPLYIALLALSLRAAAAPIKPSGPFADVPRAHWAYDAVQVLESHGVWLGYPDGAFTGNVARTRYEFAVATQRVVQEVQRREKDPDQRMLATGVDERLQRAVAQKFGDPAHASDAEILDRSRKLVREFRPELIMLGSDTEKVEAWFVKPTPPAVQAPPRKPDAELSPKAVAGRRRAQTEWKRGRVTVYGGRDPYDRLLGVPVSWWAVPLHGYRDQELYSAHNEELYRLALDKGLPANSRRQWSEDVLEPAHAWSASSHLGPFAFKADATLDAHVRKASWGSVSVSLQLLTASRGETARLEVRSRGKRLEIPLEHGAASVELRRPERKSGLIFARYPVTLDGRPGHMHLTIDYGMGAELNRQFLPNRPPRYLAGPS